LLGPGFLPSVTLYTNADPPNRQAAENTSQTRPQDRWFNVSVQPFEEIVTAHGSTVMRVCRALLDPVAAEDAWSETFVAALRAYPDLRPDSNVRGWLVTIAHHKAIDQLRAAQRAPTPLGQVPEPASGAPTPTGLDGALAASVAALPPKQQRAVILHYVAGLPYAEVGVVMEIDPAAARRNAADGIATLRMTYARGGTRS